MEVVQVDVADVPEDVEQHVREDVKELVRPDVMEHVLQVVRVDAKSVVVTDVVDAQVAVAVALEVVIQDALDVPVAEIVPVDAQDNAPVADQVVRLIVQAAQAPLRKDVLTVKGLVLRLVQVVPVVEVALTRVGADVKGAQIRVAWNV